MFPAFPDPCTRDARLDALALQVNHLETALKAALQQSIVPFSYHDRNGEDDDDNSNNNNNNSEQPFFLSSFPSPTPKWTWPPTALAIVKELRVLAQQQEDFLRSPLDDLLAWPDKSSADPHLFFDAKEGFETFYRSETWFGQMGFERYVTPYTFSDAWDKRLLHATFLVPTDLKKGCRVRVMWVLHGGGFVSRFLSFSTNFFFSNFTVRTYIACFILSFLFLVAAILDGQHIPSPIMSTMMMLLNSIGPHMHVADGENSAQAPEILSHGIHVPVSSMRKKGMQSLLHQIIL